MINRETWRPRIVFLWSRLPAYAFACLNQLRTYLGDHMKIYSIGDPPKYFQSTSPWQNARIEVLPRHVVETSQLKKITSEINSFHPDFAFLTGWSIPLVRQLAPRLRTQNVRTICMADTPWMGQVRQIIRAGIGRNMIHRWFDAIWVPGERARYLAEFAGFPSERIWMNLYCADFEKFNEAYRKYGTQRENTFIFTGRLEKVKNIALLLNAYQEYYSNVQNPWTLRVVGNGEQRSILAGVRGIQLEGWQDQNETAKMMATSGCFVLPSCYEPWGVVVHEAATVGLPLLLSDRVGSCPEFVRDGVNGRVFNHKRSGDLARAMKWIHDHEHLDIMRQFSHAIASTLTPEIWAQYLIVQCKELVSKGNI